MVEKSIYDQIRNGDSGVAEMNRDAQNRGDAAQTNNPSEPNQPTFAEQLIANMEKEIQEGRTERRQSIQKKPTVAEQIVADMEQKIDAGRVDRRGALQSRQTPTEKLIADAEAQMQDVLAERQAAANRDVAETVQHYLLNRRSE